ncbi:putative 2-phosphosulfolactate phosphatase [Pirellulimonas nuda]|uniref:Probable 2-phosphosulfolactate phosphatase n=1 Tax=Pirellulimonas nuda TaxID=2528009 RepID=A0A518D9F4_9BACT|nr:2-phosphosulfolactate phosphatase [Pirellulimonas nuda]QDU88127.1 putative 2-phosphosulfolactate phosphatase [Pirellulimonas nuda]
MPARLAVHYLPQFVPETDLAGATVVMIDLLRASSTICQALANGASEVLPFVEVDEVLRAADGRDRSAVLLGGERDAQPPEGFDLGNSPLDYTPDRVFGRQVLFTTTNGARALWHARLASRVLVGCIRNLSAVVDSVAADQDVHLLCAGTAGHVTREDLLAAGAIAAELQKHEGREASDPAHAAIGEWQELLTTARALERTPSQQLADELRGVPHGQTLVGLGYEADLDYCAEIDALSIVPIFDPATGVIRPA